MIEVHGESVLVNFYWQFGKLCTNMMGFLYFFPLIYEQMKYEIVNNTKKFLKFTLVFCIFCQTFL